MDIEVKVEDLSQVDCGGGLREVKAVVTIDKTQSYRLQRQHLLYESLASMLEYVIPHEIILDITNELGNTLDQLDGLIIKN